MRIQAIKALQVVPEAKEKILNNEVSLNSLAKAQNLINQMNKQLMAFSITVQKELIHVAATTHMQKLEIETKREERDQQPLSPPLVTKKIARIFW